MASFRVRVIISYSSNSTLTLFSRKLTKHITKTAKMHSDRRAITLLQEMRVAEANGEVRFLTECLSLGNTAHAQ